MLTIQPTFDLAPAALLACRAVLAVVIVVVVGCAIVASAEISDPGTSYIISIRTFSRMLLSPLAPKTLYVIT